MPQLGLGLGLQRGIPTFSGLLNAFPNAAAAYSLRALSRNWLAGDVVEVRRSSDSATQDFTASQILSGALEAFCGVGDGLVSTWYDQSGNGDDATQGTNTAQPRIVQAGSLVVGGLDFDGVDDFFDMPSGTYDFANSANKTLIVVSKSDATGSGTRRQFFMGVGGTTRVALWKTTDTSNAVSFNGFANAVTVAFDNTNQFLAYAEDLNGTQNFYINGGNLQSNASGGTNNDVDTAEISNATNPNQDWSGVMTEIIIYKSDQSANRVGIETNINDFYSIY